MSYTKLHSSIIASTVWRLPNPTRIVWITMLALADRDGVIEGSVPGLSDIARVTIPECRQALDSFLSPDEDSRTQDFDGRRIEKIDGGWRLLNYEAYREKLSQTDQRKNAADRAARYRKRKSVTQSPEAVTDEEPETEENEDISGESSRSVTLRHARHAPSRKITLAEAEAEAEAEQKRSVSQVQQLSLSQSVSIDRSSQRKAQELIPVVEVHFDRSIDHHTEENMDKPERADPYQHQLTPAAEDARKLQEAIGTEPGRIPKRTAALAAISHHMHRFIVHLTGMTNYNPPDLAMRKEALAAIGNRPTVEAGEFLRLRALALRPRGNMALEVRNYAYVVAILKNHFQPSADSLQELPIADAAGRHDESDGAS